MKKTIIVMPVANEEDTMAALLDEILALPYGNLFIYLIIDGFSKDHTESIIRDYEEKTDRVRCIFYKESTGVASCYLYGFKVALSDGAEQIIEMDGGGSHRPSEIPQFIDRLGEGYECVWGSRFISGGGVENDALYRLAISKGGTWLSDIVLGTRLKDMTSGFEAFTRKALLQLDLDAFLSKGHMYQTEMRYYCRNQNTIEVPIHYIAGGSSLRPSSVIQAISILFKLKEHESVVRGGTGAENSPAESKPVYPGYLLWSIAGIIFLLFFFSFCYSDTTSILRYEIGFADSVIHGEFAHLYRRAYDAILAAQQLGLEGDAFPTYDTIFNLVLGLWGIPLYYIQNAISVDFRICFRAVAYGKSILLVALAISVWLIYIICRSLGMDRNKAWMPSFLFLTSSLTTTCVGVVGQSDIIVIVFILLGFLSYIKRRDGWFLLCFIIAYPFKQYALFVFFPLLLLRDKNIVRIAVKIGIIVGTSWILNWPVRNDEDIFAYKNRFSGEMFSKLMENKLPLAYNGIPMVLLLFGFICVYSFLRQPGKDKNKEDGIALFIALLAMTSVFVGFPSFCYWYMHLVPWISIACIYFVKHTKEIMLFETVGMAALTYSNYVLYYWCYDINNMKNMLLYRIMGNPDIEGVFPMESMASKMCSRHCQMVAQAVFVVCMVTICFLCGRACRDGCEGENCKKESENHVLGWALARFAVNTLICSVPIVMFICNVGG